MKDIGSLYYVGMGVSQSYTEALRWYKKAAELGYAPASYSIGIMYWSGKGVRLSGTDALHWFRKAAEQGSEKAKVQIGMAYLSGSDMGVKSDIKVAKEWFGKACDGGYQLGCDLYSDKRPF